MAKKWTIPTILRELRRVVLEMNDTDIMDSKLRSDYGVRDMLNGLTKFHMDKEMEIPGQTAIPVEDKAKRDDQGFVVKSKK